MNALEKLKGMKESKIFTTNINDVRRNNLNQSVLKIVRPDKSYFVMQLNRFLEQIEKNEIKVVEDKEDELSFSYNLTANDPFA